MLLLLDPDSDTATNEWTPTLAVDHYTIVDQGIREPAVPDTGNWLSDANDAHTEEYEIETPCVDCTSAKIWIYGESLSSDSYIQADFSANGSDWEGSKTIISTLGGIGWYSVNWNGPFSGPMTSAKMRIIHKEATGGSSRIYSTYVELFETSSSSSSLSSSSSSSSLSSSSSSSFSSSSSSSTTA